MKRGGREENDYSCKVNDEDDETTWCRQGKSLGFLSMKEKRKKKPTGMTGKLIN